MPPTTSKMSSPARKKKKTEPTKAPKKKNRSLNISHEVDCESLFSIAGYEANPRRSNTNIRLYERFVLMKHRLGRMYVHLPDVRELYMKRWEANDWDEGEERESQEFLDLEKEIYLKMFPNNKEMFDEKDDDEAEEEKEAEDKGSILDVDSNTSDGSVDDSDSEIEVVEERKLAAKPTTTKPAKKPGNKKKNESTKERRERKEKERKEKEMASEQHV